MITVYIWTEELYNRRGSYKRIPLCSWDYPITPSLGDMVTVDGIAKRISTMRKIFEAIGDDLIINVIVQFREGI